ncbi:MAG: hypothetical protein LCH69_01250 [Proteobacteria bacterium]|nr:hypothetical protein [Pseudomonadota bacterium]
MGAIVAYTSDPDEDKARRDGLAALGSLLISNTDPSVADKAEGLRQALYDAKHGSMLDLRFQSNNLIPPAVRGYRIDVPGSKKDKEIKCPLTNDRGDKVGTLILTEIDDKNKVKHGGVSTEKDEYQMHVVFPENDDDTGLTYLKDTAEDALEIGSPGGDLAKIIDYLAAFKFLSRCK